MQLGSPCHPGHTSHFVLVKKKLITEDVCNTRDYEDMEGMVNYYPVANIEPVEGDEIVVFNRLFYSFPVLANLYSDTFR